MHSLVVELKRIFAPGGTLDIWTPDARDWRRKRQLEAWKEGRDAFQKVVLL